MRRFLRKSEVLARLNIKREALREAIERGEFPPPAKIFEGGRAVGWEESIVDAYIEQRCIAAHQEVRTMEMSNDETRDSEQNEHRTDQPRFRQHRAGTRCTAGGST